MVQMVPDSLMVFSGNANPKLAQAVVQHLNIPLGRATVSRFSDGEVQVELNENVRGAMFSSSNQPASRQMTI